jgi:DMSO/TMAO reductase YedYZ molybdopterin-dependent catalytic subunit
MRKNYFFLKVALLFFFSFSLGLAGGCASPEETAPPVDAVSEATESRYRELEIRDYEGMRLDPSIGPRDNSIAGIQQVDLDDYSLQITGLVRQPVTFTYDQVLEKDSFQRLITLYCVEGWDATILWEGVRIMDLLEEAGPEDENVVVIFHAVDGYTTSMPLETIKERDMLLAYSSNGIILPAALGFPFIVVAEDKLGYKWARWVNEIELSDDLNYHGFWESRGYSNSAEVD